VPSPVPREKVQIRLAPGFIDLNWNACYPESREPLDWLKDHPMKLRPRRPFLRLLRTALALAAFVTTISPHLHGALLREYRLFTGTGTSPQTGRTYVVLRQFRFGAATRYLVVNPETLQSGVLDARDLQLSPVPWEAIAKQFEKTPYFKAIRDAEAGARGYENAGLTHFPAPQSGVTLTVDLCPSKKPLDRILFTDLIRAFDKDESPVPVAVALTGVWMEKHGSDLAWLRSLEKSGLISVTWINHSYHHDWNKKLPLKANFLLEKGTDVPSEILRTEAAMLGKGIVPSVFFRFPGLVSDAGLVTTIGNFGLIPVGSDAWLAKNQLPKDGSIVLVHANGNEPIGIRRFLSLLKTERENIVHKHWLLYDLRESAVLLEKRKPASREP